MKSLHQIFNSSSIYKKRPSDLKYPDSAFRQDEFKLHEHMQRIYHECGVDFNYTSLEAYQYELIKLCLKYIRVFIGRSVGREVKKLCWQILQNLMEKMTVDINAAEFNINPRYRLQHVFIPEKKRGNLSKYAGKNVIIITTNIKRGSPRINFYIKESKIDNKK